MAIAWTGQKLEELLTQFSRETSPDVWDGIATRLCALLTALVQRQPARRSGDKTLKGLGSKIAIVLHRVLVATNVSSESRSMALEAAGAWIKISADMGLKCQELQDLFNISLHAAERGLQGPHSEQNVAADAALRFLVLFVFYFFFARPLGTFTWSCLCRGFGAMCWNAQPCFASGGFETF